MIYYKHEVTARPQEFSFFFFFTMSSHYAQRHQTKSNDIATQRHPQAWIKINGRFAKTEMESRTNPADLPEHEELYPGNALPTDMTDQKLFNIEWAPAYFMKADWSSPGGGGMNTRDLLNQDNAVEAIVPLNGLLAKKNLTPEAQRLEVKNKIEPAGFIEMGNADNKSTRYNLLRGGAFSVMFNAPNGCRLNAFLELDVPTLEESDVMMSHAAALALGRKGIVSLMMREWNPIEADYTSTNGLVWYLSKRGTSHEPLETKAIVAILEAVHTIGNAVNLHVTPNVFIATMHADLAASAKSGKHSLVTKALNSAIQGMGAVKLQREKWILLQADQVGINGKWTSVHGISYGF